MKKIEYSDLHKEELEEMKLLLEMYEKLKDNKTFQAFFEEREGIKIEKLQM